jgi:hypothetical protein
MPATRNHVTITGITVDRFKDGMIVEAWRDMDTLALLRGTGGGARP